MPLPADEPTDEERQEELPDDYETPFSRPDPVSDDPVADPAATDDPDDWIATEDESVGDDEGEQPAKLDDTHPDTDTDIEAEDVYDEGVSGAANAEEPAESDVIGYDPDKDQRNQQ